MSDAEIVKKMEGKAVLVVGDIMLDRFVYGRVDRISPESPVPVLTVERENTMLGGAGNTLFNLVNLKCRGKILSVVGEDDAGNQIRTLAEASGIDVSGLISSGSRPSIVKTRFLAGHQQLLRTDLERIEPVSAEICKILLRKFEGLLEGASVVVLSDYGKGLLTKDFVASVIAQAHARNIPVLVDPKGFDYSLYEGADVVTPNKKELAEATQGAAVGTDVEIENAARILIEKNGVKAVVATRSKDGMSVIGVGDPVHIKSATDIEVFDVSGAGDTVIATLAAGLSAGLDLVQAARVANVAGSIVVSKIGTAPIRADELAKVLSCVDAGKTSTTGVRGVCAPDWEQAKEDVQRWRARGLKVGFTNGCFDILHIGHVSYLQEARARCDRLVVGLNNDASVRALKGASRPVHDEFSRAGVLAALGAVDMVILFGEESGQDNTACKLIEFLQPDIYFKGGDYTLDQIPEAPSVQACGGVVEVMPVYEGHSTTASIVKIGTAR